MAYVMKNAIVLLDSTDISSSIRQVAVEMTADDVDVTSMGANGHQHLAGLRQDKFTFEAYTAFGANTLHSLVATKFAAGGTLQVDVYPNPGGSYGATAGTLNPKFTGFAPLLTYSPVAGQIGEAAMTPLELPVNGTITVATS